MQKNDDTIYKTEAADAGDRDISTSRHIYSAQELRIIRKLDWHLMPLVFVLYSFSVLDRSNLGNAKLAGLQNAIDLRGNHYQWLATLFYIACEGSLDTRVIVNTHLIVYQISFLKGLFSVGNSSHPTSGVLSLYSSGDSWPPSKPLSPAGQGSWLAAGFLA